MDFEGAVQGYLAATSLGARAGYALHMLNPQLWLFIAGDLVGMDVTPPAGLLRPSPLEGFLARADLSPEQLIIVEQAAATARQASYLEIALSDPLLAFDAYDGAAPRLGELRSELSQLRESYERIF
jgi:hypothetical protein